MNEFGRRKEGVERRRLSDRENIERLRRSNQLAHLD